MARRSAVGLDVGTHAVHVAQVSLERGQPVVTNFGGVALPENAVREGEVVDVDTVAAAISQLFADAGIRDRRVHIGVSNQRVVVRQVDLPYMDEEELRGALRFQVQEYIPIPVEEAELDFQTMDEFTGDGGARMLRVMLVAAHREMVATHVGAATRARLRPVSVDLNAFAVLRALVPDPESVAGGEMLVDVGAGVTNILVHERGVPRFVRILVLGGGHITEALVGGLAVPYHEAEATKAQRGLDTGDDETARIIDARADQFVDEVRGSLDYYLAQTGTAQVARVLLTGGGAKLRGLPERLSDTLRMPVEVGHAFQGVPPRGSVYGREELAEVEPVLTTAIGLALGGLTA
ncbi:MAG TPA: type IV pilus assembly protein PilM [Nitriliruptorales bacterium]|nr:type IV pilus assembly protein PilM [Nitriliruptorales bacterium]